MKTRHPSTHFQNIFSSGKLSGSSILDKHNITFTAKARGAIYKVLKSIEQDRGDTVLVPAFHCPTVVQPVLYANYKIRYYTINKDLSFDKEELLQLIDEQIAAVIIINFFGFEQSVEAIKKVCNEHDALLLEDCSHSFVQVNPLKLSGHRGDVSVFSFWKLVPCHIGGGIRINHNSLTLQALSERGFSLYSHLKMLKRIVEESIENLDDRNLFKKGILALERLRQKLKLKKPNSRGAASIATPSAQTIIDEDETAYPYQEAFFSDSFPAENRWILEHAQLETCCKQRRENYQKLLEELRNIDGLKLIFPELPDTVCPWGIPALVENRAEVELTLQEKGVLFFTFGEKLHKSLNQFQLISQNARRSALVLSSSLICFSIHQDLIPEVLNKTGDIVRQVLSERSGD